MYSVNQVTQFYVVTQKNVQNPTAPGQLSPVITTDPDYIYFKYCGKGGVIATDRIKKGKVKWVTYTDANHMDKPKRVVEIAFNNNVNSGNPVPGEDYIINFSFRNYFGMSDEDTYEKHASARAFSSDTKSTMLARLAISLAKNMSREVDKPFEIFLLGSADPLAPNNQDEFGPITVNTKIESLNGTYSKIVLKELEQPWELGRFKATRPEFKTRLVPITVNGIEEYNWATITETLDTDDVIGNGRETADLEWFCMGERGDQYRGKDWPLSITTTASMMVNPEARYDYVIVHFWDDIDNEGPQKSERDMIFVGADNVGMVNVADSIVNALRITNYLVNGAVPQSSPGGKP